MSGRVRRRGEIGRSKGVVRGSETWKASDKQTSQQQENNIPFYA